MAFPLIHLAKGLDPVADAFSGTVASDVIDVQGKGLWGVIYKGVGATGTSTITVLACSNNTPSATTAVPFWYRACTTTDTWGDWTAATTAGFTTTAGSSQLYQIYVDADVIAATGYKYAEIQAVEVVDSPVLGGILLGVVEPHYQPDMASMLD